MQLVDGFCFAYGVSKVLTVGKYRSLSGMKNSFENIKTPLQLKVFLQTGTGNWSVLSARQRS